MPAIAAIQFTQDQMRALTSVSAETLRHWRRTVPYLASKMGKAARFSFADLVGLSVTNELVSSLGVHIGSMSMGVNELFKLLADVSAPTLNGAIVLLTPTTATLYESGARHFESALKQPTLAIPLDPLITHLQQHMLPVMPVSAQTALPFPPEAIRSRA